jgi:hypothetical protein
MANKCIAILNIFNHYYVFKMESLKAISRRHPKGRWWLKADACDVRIGLRESLKNVWTGDTDLGDGFVQKLHNEYKEQLNFVRTIGLKKDIPLPIYMKTYIK